MKISELKVGDELIAIDECTMENGTGNALTIGKQYKIIYISENYLVIDDDFGDGHGFKLHDLHEFFKIKAPKEPIDELIEWLSMVSKHSKEQAVSFTEMDMELSANCSSAMETAYNLAIKKAKQLKNR